MQHSTGYWTRSGECKSGPQPPDFDDFHWWSRAVDQKKKSKRHFNRKAAYLLCVLFFGHSWAADRNDVVQGDMRLEKWPSMMCLVLWILWLQWCLHDCLGTTKTEFASPDVNWKVVAVRDSDKGWSSRTSRGHTICITWILEEPFWDCSMITNSSAVSIPEGFPSMFVLETAQGPAASSRQHDPAWGTMRGAALESILKELCRRIWSNPLKRTLDSKKQKHSHITHGSTHIHPGCTLQILWPEDIIIKFTLKKK